MKERLKHIFLYLEEYLAGGLILIMAAIAFINVVSRFTLKLSISYIEELEIYLYVWLVLLGSAIAFKKWKHLSVSIIVEKFSPKARKVVEVFVALFSIAFFVILLRFSITQIQDEILLDVTTTSMGLPLWWFSMGLPVGSVIIIIRIIQRVVVVFKEGGEDRDVE
ncbi:MAG: TRAP transporter small permease [Halanaerobium sp.]|nr:TRAP transporter small permease [Halanaerobium sp.]